MTSQWPSPLQFGPWLLERRLAVSAMSEVWLGQLPGDAHRCAVKRLLPIHRGDALMRALFQQEITLHKRLNDVRVPPLLASGEANDVPYLCTRYYRGASLQALMAAGPLPRAEALWLASELAAALAAVHAAGIVHADVSPDNVYIRDDGGVLLLDFGIAVLHGDRAPPRRGRLRYASPEQQSGAPLTAQTDLFALKRLLGELGLDDVQLPENAAFAAEALRAGVDDAVQQALAERVARVRPALRHTPWQAAELRGEAVTDPGLDTGATRTR